MEHRDEIGFQVNAVSHRVRQMVNQLGQTDENAVPGMQGWIIGYLYRNRDRDVFQRDVQAHFSIRRSTVTGLLQTMEKNGLIRRTSVDWDARLKKLELTPRAMELHEKVVQGIQRTEETLSSMLTPEEKQTFIRLCEKIRSGIEDQYGEKM